MPLSPQDIQARELTGPEIQTLAARWLDPQVADSDKAAELVALDRRGETAEELAAFAMAFLPYAVDPSIQGTWNGKALLDCCGTGGGGLSLFNVSTGMMFLLGAMGIPVVKHGNRAVTKSSGSADVLSALGIPIESDITIGRQLEEVGVAFLFAPRYQPSFAVISPVRKELGARRQRTIFNLLGPLLNPARPAARLVGVFSPERVDLYTRALDLMGSQRHVVVCGFAEGTALGEVSATDQTYWKRSGTLLSQPESGHWLGQERGNLSEVLVSGAGQSAQLIERVLSSQERGLARHLLMINAAAAAWAQGSATSLEEGLALAAKVIDSGEALLVLNRWRLLFKT